MSVTHVLKKADCTLSNSSLVTRAASEKAEADLSLDLWRLVVANQSEKNYIID